RAAPLGVIRVSRWTRDWRTQVPARCPRGCDFRSGSLSPSLDLAADDPGPRARRLALASQGGGSGSGGAIPDLPGGCAARRVSGGLVYSADFASLDAGWISRALPSAGVALGTALAGRSEAISACGRDLSDSADRAGRSGTLPCAIGHLA